MVPRGDRSGQIIEPWLTDQWFVKMDDLGRLGLEAVESGQVEFVPGNWINTYRHWMENLQDWCISRQLSWGHRIPAWYDEDGNIHVGRSEADARQRGGLADNAPLTRDEIGRASCRERVEVAVMGGTLLAERQQRRWE